MFDAYGYSLDQFNTYVEECKKRGFAIEEGCFEGFYSADNEAGYNVYLYYNEDDDCMSGTIKSPDKQFDVVCDVQSDDEISGEKIRTLIKF